jgi:hypothetical protein
VTTIAAKKDWTKDGDINTNGPFRLRVGYDPEKIKLSILFLNFDRISFNQEMQKAYPYPVAFEDFPAISLQVISIYLPGPGRYLLIPGYV